VFAQIIRGKTSDPKAVRASLDKWMKDLQPGAKGYLGTTSGVTDDGQLFALVRFDSEGSARANSARAEQGAWWSEFSKSLDGEATFRDSNNVLIEAPGDLDSAKFVQVIVGQSTDLNRSREIMTEMASIREAGRPEILGSVSVGHEDGMFSHVLYFTSEEEARAGERKEPPPQAKALLEEMQSLSSPPEFLDLKDPWIDSPQ
jgi:hypothetical protein